MRSEVTTSRRRFSQEFKDELCQEVISTSKSIKDVAVAYGVGPETLRNWLNKYREANGGTEDELTLTERVRRRHRSARPGRCSDHPPTRRARTTMAPHRCVHRRATAGRTPPIRLISQTGHGTTVPKTGDTVTTTPTTRPPTSSPWLTTTLISSSHHVTPTWSFRVSDNT